MGLLAFAVLGATGGWQAHRALSVKDHLEVVKGELLQLRAAATATGDPTAVTGSLRTALSHAAEARRITAGADWALLERLPFVGDGTAVVRSLSDSAAELTEALTDLQQSGTALAATGMRSMSDLRLVLAAVAKAEPVLKSAAARLDAVRARLVATPASTGLSELDEARATALAELDKLHGWLGAAETAAALLPPMLGRDGPRRYFLAFQTNAEARGTGGLVGAFGILEVAGGRINVKRLDSNAGIAEARTPVVDYGPAYRARYGPGATSLLSISNLSPHFPYAAGIWTGLWERQTGRRLDGAIATDPEGLAYLLRLIGPVTLPGGERVTADNVVDLTERAAYERFEDPVERKRFLIGIAGAVSESLTGHLAEPAAALPILAELISERRLQVWSRREAEQRLLAATPLGGELPASAGPFAGLVVNNAAGGKLDYYLERSVDYELGPCYGGLRYARVRIRLGNDVPRRPLSSYVTGRLDSPEEKHAEGANLLWVSLYAGVGARLNAAWLDGRAISVLEGKERSHPVFSKMVELAPRQSRTLELSLVEPSSNKPAQAPAQPLVRPQRTRIMQNPQGCTP
ncbi:DUF4012 domain-containing protein [Nonomuraea sp. NBC_01738]|uniref:DUF4012 domain-containing protein n=1 Tax=Nonomuraea sp. NBC_01738 TaxID=2976003 RepID=UPI002E152212|nr:DUF4012 domain-containing protein [Nonomuraea sp. NBC_01738]